MHNWGCDLKKLKRYSQEAFERFVLEQKINYGLGKVRLSKKMLLRYWNQLNLDPFRRRFLAFLLWPKKF